MHWGVKDYRYKDRNAWLIPKKFRVHTETEISVKNYCTLDTIVEVNSDDYTLITGNLTSYPNLLDKINFF